MAGPKASWLQRSHATPLKIVLGQRFGAQGGVAILGTYCLGAIGCKWKELNCQGSRRFPVNSAVNDHRDDAENINDI